MKEAFPPLFLIAQKKAKDHSCSDSTSMAPVVDARHQKTEYKDPQCPRSNLFVDGLTVDAAAALTVVKGSADQAAHRPGGTDGERYSSEVGNQKAKHPTQGVEGNHPVSSIFADNQRRNLPEGNHIEQNVQDAAVQVVGRDKGPPAVEAVDGDGSGCPQHQEAFA